jgi:regulatory protein YycH of two-component signal transduction system YycFG
MVIERPGLKIYFLITTRVVISLVVSFILWLFRKWPAPVEGPGSKP